MKNKIISAMTILDGTGVSVLDAARLIRNVFDAMPEGSKLGQTPLQFCSKIIEVGKRHFRFKEMSVSGGFALYLEAKRYLRPDSFKDIRYLGNRLLKSKPEFAARNFSELTLAECEEWLSSTFYTSSQFKRSANEISPKAKDPKGETAHVVSASQFKRSANEISPKAKDPKGETAHAVSASQFNKARAMLHGLFEFAVRREWCDKNVIKLIEKRKVIEKEIKPLTLTESKKLLTISRMPKYRDCSASVGLLLLAGVRPREVRRLEWRDIDLDEGTITVRSLCSKTGGVRQVEICPSLKTLLLESIKTPDEKICPRNWAYKWKAIRIESGFKGQWIQDILRHTYASYHAKNYRNLSRLQLNMGHRDQSLLRSRYVNMAGISGFEAKVFFN